MKLKPLHGTIGRRLVIHDAPRALKEEILRALTFRNPDYDSIKKFSPYANTRVPEFICMGAEVEDELWLPRGYDGHGLRGWSAARFRSIKWTYSTNRWPVVFPKKLLKPNAEQKVMLDALKKVHYANKRPAGNYLLLAGTGFGKAQPVSTLIPTPKGIRPLAELVVGDEVFGPDGLPTKITGIFPQGVKQVFNVRFKDGAETQCCDDHLWFTQTWHERNKLRTIGRVRPLHEIRKTLLASGGQRNHAVPITEPVAFPQKVLPLHPYLLGALLGNGHFADYGVFLTTADSFISDRVNALLPGKARLTRGTAYNSFRVDGALRGGQPNVVKDLLGSLGLIGTDALTKFVPQIYLEGSIEQRRQLLAGLLDTDGYVSKNGLTVEFSSSSPRLALAVQWLARSLGALAQISSKVPTFRYKGKRRLGATAYCVRIQATECYFQLPRKRSRWKAPTKYLPTRYIEEVMPIGKEKCACISVAHPSHLYLCNDFIVTHNTITGILCGAFLGHRVLVLCRTNLIRNAWQDDLYRVFGMNREDVGLIQQKTCRIGEHFTLATIATLGRRREKWRELFAQFGTVIIDEVHIIGSDTVHDIAANCGARYLIGLTATTKRADGKDYVLRHELGKKIVHVKNTGQETSSSLPIKDVQTIYTNFRYNPPSKRDIDIHEVNAKLVEDMERNRLIVDNAIKDFDEGHYVIVTSPVLNHLDVLRQMLKDRGYEFSLLTGETNANKFYTQNLIEGVLRGTVRGVLASQNAVKLGANINPLDRLHIAIPPSNPTDVEQLVGRIRRKAPGKVDALVRYYLDDKCAYLSRRYRKAFVPVMRKLHVPKFLNLWIA